MSLVLSISSRVDKKTDGTREVRGLCYGWQVCLFGLSLISCFPPPHPELTLPTVWPGSDHAEMDQGHFSPRKSTLTAPLTTQANSKHMGQVWAYYPFSDKNNNWLICSCIAELSVKTVGGILAKINMADSNSKYTYQVKWWKLVEKSLLTFCNVLLLLHGYMLLKNFLQGITG